MSKEIRIKIDGSASGNNRTVIASDLQILGRVYNTVTGAYETDWAPLPVRELDMHIEPVSAIEASVVLRVSEIENLRLVLPEANITAADELDAEIGGPMLRRTLPHGHWNVFIGGSTQEFRHWLSTQGAPGDWLHARHPSDVLGLRGICSTICADDEGLKKPGSLIDRELFYAVHEQKKRLDARNGGGDRG